MNELDQLLRGATWRRGLLDWGERLVRSWSVSFSLAAVAILLGKWWRLGTEPTTWDASWLAGTAVVGLFVSLIWTWWQRATVARVSVELDQQLGLSERLSTAWTLPAEQRETPMAQALVADLRRRISPELASEAFPLRLGRRAWWPLPPLAAALLAIFFIDPRFPDASALGAGTLADPAVKESTQQFQRQVAALREQAREKDLKEALASLDKLEVGAKQVASQPRTEHRETLVKLNDLARELEQRRETLGGNSLQQQMQQLAQLDRELQGPLAQALKKGDFAKAAQEIQNLRKQLEKSSAGKENADARAKASEQLQRLQQSLDKLVQSQKEQRQQLERLLRQQQEKGDTAAAEKTQRQLDELPKPGSGGSPADQMAAQVANAAKAMAEGDAAALDQALANLQQNLAQLGDQAANQAMIDEALKQLAQCKGQMQGAGDGTVDCKLQGKGPGSPIDKPGGTGAGKGGLHAGRGKGPPVNQAPTEKDGRFYNTNESLLVKGGPSQMVREVDGPNRPGQVHEKIGESLPVAEGDAGDPLADAKLPRDYLKRAGRYFDRYRQGREGGT